MVNAYRMQPNTVSMKVRECTSSAYKDTISRQKLAATMNWNCCRTGPKNSRTVPNPQPPSIASRPSLSRRLSSFFLGETLTAYTPHSNSYSVRVGHARALCPLFVLSKAIPGNLNLLVHRNRRLTKYVSLWELETSSAAILIDREAVRLPSLNPLPPPLTIHLSSSRRGPLFP